MGQLQTTNAMQLMTTSDILYSDACLIFIIVGVVCAAVRWAHMCRPYAEEASFFYPARKQATFFFAAVLMEIPYLLQPADDATMTYIRVWGVVYCPVCFTMLFLRYFRGQQLPGRTIWLDFGLPMLMLTAMMVAVMVTDGTWIERHMVALSCTGGAVGILLSVRLIRISAWMKQGIDNYHHANYSTEADFPYRFAQRMLVLPMIWIAIMWMVFLTGSRPLKLVVDLLLSVWMVHILCIILHPQRIPRQAGAEQYIQGIEEEAKKQADQAARTPSGLMMGRGTIADSTPAAYSDEVRDQVIAIILRRYREPHLLKTEVLADVDRGLTAPASRFIASIGYYTLINMFRLRHAELYAAAHPGAKQAEVAAASGYLSDQALSRARRNVTDIDPTFVAGVKL